MTRPDKAQLSKMIHDLEAADKKLAAITSEQEIWKGKVFSSYHALQREAAEEKLREIPVEELNRDKSGIRIQLLRDHGITSVADLSDMTAEQLSASIDGIGPESARKILDKTAELRESSLKYARVRLDGKSRNKDMQQVISALAFLIRTKQPAMEAQRLYEENHTLIERQLPAAKKLKSSLGWLFTSKAEKEKRLSAYERLAKLPAAELDRQASELSAAYAKLKRQYSGGVSAGKRQEIIDAFSTSQPGSVLACQIIAAGTGLNIQAASVVIICEPQWKPSTETQAISRAYRMGQTQTVMVHRLLADDTVDERIMEILKEKTELFEGFADESAVGEAGKTMLEQGGDISDEKQQTLMKQIVEEERKKYSVQ